MVVSAHDVAAALRERVPGLPIKKLHKLLYYCQGHHLAAFGTPLFGETLSAWDMGPVVGSLWFEENRGEAPPLPSDLSEAELNTVGYVVSRYGALTGLDLENLTHSESPWRIADGSRRPGESVRIHLDWIRDYFATHGADQDEDEQPALDSGAVTRWLRDAPARRSGPGLPDDPAEIQARRTRSA